MIRFVSLAEDAPELRFSPVYKAGRAVLIQSANKQGICLTGTGAFNRDFVDLTAREWNWPGMDYAELIRGRQFIRETDFLALQTIHQLLLKLRLARHDGGYFRVTRLGQQLLSRSAMLFSELIPYYILCVDHVAVTGYAEPPPGDWQCWLSSVEAMPDAGFSESDIFYSVYENCIGPASLDCHYKSAFVSAVLRPLLWAGLIHVPASMKVSGHREKRYCKTPLWHAALTRDVRVSALRSY